MLIETNRERKRKGKGSDSPGSDNPRARKIQRNDDESSDSREELRVGKITDPWKPKKRLRKRKNRKEGKDESIKITDAEQSDSDPIISQVKSKEKMAYLRREKNIKEGLKITSTPLAYPSKTKTYETNKENIITEAMDDGA
jgi:hypothetical protein